MLETSFFLESLFCLFGMSNKYFRSPNESPETGFLGFFHTRKRVYRRLLWEQELHRIPGKGDRTTVTSVLGRCLFLSMWR